LTKVPRRKVGVRQSTKCAGGKSWAKLAKKKKGGYGKGKKENYKKKGNLRMERCGLKVRKQKTVGVP